ncbi:hypothetical protein SK128_013407, partial [Halocaridina rubra]
MGVCIRLKVHHFRMKTYVFSYATSDKDNNEFNFGFKVEDAYVAIGSNYYSNSKTVFFSPRVWYHFCFVVNNTNYSIYIDGVLDHARKITERSILANASFVLGQETDVVLGGYQEHQSYSGHITDFNVFSYALTDEDVQGIANCSSTLEGDLVAWSSVNMTVEGNVLELDLSPGEFCTKKTQLTMFPERRTLADATHWCNNLKAKIALPRSPKQNNDLYNISKAFFSVCQPPNHARIYLWIGANDVIENTKFTDVEGNPLAYHNFRGTYNSVRLSCVGMTLPPNDGGWDDASCSSLYSFCVACEEHQPTVLKMRGLCEFDKKAAFCRLYPQYGELAVFRGFTKYEIHFNASLLTWILWDIWTGDTVATYFAYDSSYPLGRHIWTLATDYYVCGLLKGTEHSLALSACYDWEYSCDDATCINLTQRCDLRVDCPDASDEISCNKLSLPEDYLATITPPGVFHGPLQMDLNVSLLGFSE